MSHLCRLFFWQYFFSRHLRFMTTAEHRNKDWFKKLKVLHSLKAPVSSPRSSKAHAELRLLYQSVYQPLFSDFRHSWTPPQGTWMSPPSAVNFRSLAENTALGRLKRHNTSIFLELIFVPSWSHAAENQSNASWRPCFEDQRVQYQFVRKKQTVHPAVPSSNTLLEASVTVNPIHIDQGSPNFLGETT